MSMNRRQRSDILRTKACLVPIRRAPMRRAPRIRVKAPLIEMGQVDSKSRAAHILARRASKQGLIKIRDIDGAITGTAITPADPRSSLRWLKNEPNLPERMIKTGQMSPEDFPRRFRSFLKNSRGS